MSVNEWASGGYLYIGWHGRDPQGVASGSEGGGSQRSMDTGNWEKIPPPRRGSGAAMVKGVRGGKNTSNGGRGVGENVSTDE